MQEGFHKGLVAYFDILGFTSIAASEDIVKSAGLVEDALLTIPSEVRKEADRKRGPGNLHRVDTHAMIFADSILLWHSLPDAELGEPYHWHFFLSVCSWFMRRMFEGGLPLRGAVSSGEYFIKEHCFVGKPITDCHDLAGKTEWAGCVIAPNAAAELEKFHPEWKRILETVCVPYRVPFKKERHPRRKSAQSLVLKWHHYEILHSSGPMPDIGETVRRTFGDHGKKFRATDESVALKIGNTVKYLEFVSTLYVNSNQKMPKRLRQKLQSS